MSAAIVKSVHKPWTAKVYEALESGPMVRYNVVELAMLEVPPARAMHVGRAKNIQDKRKRTERGAKRDATEVADKPTDKNIRCGAQRIVLGVIAQAVKSGRIEKYEEDGRIMLRLTGK